MSEQQKILFVDDEPNVLDGLRRQLRKRFKVETAIGGEEGLKKIEEDGPFAVVVSDMKMPGMNGADFLAHVRRRDPDSVRLILSGQSELDSAIAAINNGNVFRFLTKPCETENLTAGLECALEQHRLVAAEKELLEKTLFGAVEVLTQILGVVNPEAFSRASRIRQYVEGIAAGLGFADEWQIRLAAMLSQIGCISLPTDILFKAYSDERLTEHEAEMFAAHPSEAAKLLAAIPRLEVVSKMVEGELERVDRSQLPDDPRQWELPLLGAQILRAAIEYERMIGNGVARREAVRKLKQEHDTPPQIAGPLLDVAKAEGQKAQRAVNVDELATRMVLDDDVQTKTGTLLVRRGEEISYPMLVRLRNFARNQGLVEPIRVLVPL